MKLFGFWFGIIFLITLIPSKEETFCNFFAGFGKAASIGSKSNCSLKMLEACKFTQDFFINFGELFTGKSTIGKVISSFIKFLDGLDRAVDFCPDIINELNIYNEWPLMIISVVVYYKQLINNFSELIMNIKAKQYYDAGYNFGSIYYYFM